MKKRILIIENDQDIRLIVELILAEEGFSTLSIPEPTDLTGVLQFQPHLILIDEFINNKPGHRLCLRIKHEELLKHIPVIVLSTSHNIELIAIECKANDYISKPFDIDEMIKKVIRLIGEQPIHLA